MRHMIIAAIMAITLSSPGLADDRDGVRATISAQIDAFLRDDFSEAFKFASPQIQRLFRTPDNFGQMVRNGYPMVWRPATVDYLGLSNEGGRTVQEVLITDFSGQSYVLQYLMIETENGWLINGVSVVVQPGTGV